MITDERGSSRIKIVDPLLSALIRVQKQYLQATMRLAVPVRDKKRRRRS
jgi:hypothetical protein